MNWKQVWTIAVGTCLGHVFFAILATTFALLINFTAIIGLLSLFSR